MWHGVLCTTACFVRFFTGLAEQQHNKYSSTALQESSGSVLTAIDRWLAARRENNRQHATIVFPVLSRMCTGKQYIVLLGGV